MLHRAIWVESSTPKVNIRKPANSEFRRRIAAYFCGIPYRGIIGSKPPNNPLYVSLFSLRWTGVVMTLLHRRSDIIFFGLQSRLLIAPIPKSTRSGINVNCFSAMLK